MIRPAPFALALFAPLASPAASAAEVLAGPIAATVLDVIDGDTLAVRAHIWLGQAIEIRVRIAGIDTPELRGRCDEERLLAERARNALATRIAGRDVTLHEIRYGTYAGRVVARVSADGARDVAAPLIAAGLARPYAGRGPRPDWCDG